MANRGGRVPRWARNPRRAYDGDGQEIRAVTIGETLAEGIRHVDAWCTAQGCHHRGRLALETWPPGVFVPDMSLRLRCSVCGSRKTAHVIPCWPQWHGGRKVHQEW